MTSISDATNETFRITRADIRVTRPGRHTAAVSIKRKVIVKRSGVARVTCVYVGPVCRSSLDKEAGGAMDYKMSSFLGRILPRAKHRYKHLDNTIEMADHSVAPTYAHETAREEASDKRQYSKDAAGGDLDTVPSTQKLPAYQNDRDSSSTLNQTGTVEEADDVSEEDLATLRRVSDKIPMSAWYAFYVMPLT
jgi:hypothetical protein